MSDVISMSNDDPVTIRVGNIYGRMLTDDKYLLQLFFHALRFREKNYHHNPLYKRRLYDGFKNFFSMKTGKFLAGLLPEVIMALEELGREFIIDDRRDPIPDHDIITPDYLGDSMSMSGDYDYQFQVARNSLAAGRGIIKIATAGGKTVIFTAIVKALRDAPTMVLFRNTTLVDQTYEAFKNAGIENVGRVHSECFEPNVITCSTIQSIHHLESLIPEIKCLIVDECHEFTSKHSIKAFKKFKKASLRLAFSATPWSKDNEVQKHILKGWFGPIIADFTTEELQERSILSDSEAHFWSFDNPLILEHGGKRYDTDGLNWQDAYVMLIVENDHRNDLLRRIVEKQFKAHLSDGLRRRFLVLVRRISHGDALAEMLSKDYKTFWVQGKDNSETRKYVKEQLELSNEDFIIAIATRQIFGTGVNIKRVTDLANWGGYKSDIETIQNFGRGLRRIAGEKELMRYHDVMDRGNPYIEKHAEERLRIIKAEGHSITIHDGDEMDLGPDK